MTGKRNNMNNVTNTTEKHNYMNTRRACGSCCGCHALPVLSEVVLRCGRGDIAAGVRHLDSIVRARREAEERVERMRDAVIIFPLV